MSQRALKARLTSVVTGTAALGSVALVYASLIEPEWLKVEHMELSLPRLPTAFDGYRVVHLSDLHLDDRLRPGFLRRVVQAVNREVPDLVAVTGDFVHDEVAPYVSKLVPVLAGLRARDAKVGVLGNHDHFTDPDLLRRLMYRCGVEDVSNRVCTVWRGTDALHIAGVDSFVQDQDRMEAVLAQLSEEGATILLAHEPDFARVSRATGRFDLQLSGHSHAGQVRVPFIGPIRLPEESGYHTGLYKFPEMQLYTSRGVGMGRPRVRFNCRPEIAVLTLRAMPPVIPIRRAAGADV